MLETCGFGTTIAVTGSCGKSTVTAYLAEALTNLGLDPCCLNGALSNRFHSGRFAGNYRSGSREYFVFEADESDKSLLHYSPDYALVLNIGTDHYDREELARVFAEFLGRVRRGAVLERGVYEAVREKIPPRLDVRVFDAKPRRDSRYAITDYRKVERPEAIYTQEGTLLIPACSKVVATVIKIEKQRFPNKNARVYLKFECLLLPDGSAIAMSAQPLTKDGALKEGPWHTAGKLAASTVGLGIVGAGAGTGFAFIPNPAKLGVGFAIGIPVGCTVGLITGLLTPGLKYHAKEGEAIKIILCENLELCKQNETSCEQQGCR